MGTADDIKPSGFAPLPGDRFYLLSEATFSPSEEATVRLEAPEGSESGSAQGVDIRLYRVPDPINFLKKQKNLHRPTFAAEHGKDGLANALSYLWDSWYKKSRLVWQRIVSQTLRSKAVEYAPQLKQAPPYSYRTAFQNPAQFKPIPGLDLIDQFRYPVMQAKPIAPPANVQVMGSTLTVRKGNVKIPLGRLQPGLYLVEGMLGSFRASCFLFISNTVALTKLSSQQEVIWTVKKDSGDVVPGVQLVLTDGVGVLGEGSSDEQGVFSFSGKNLERSYVLGRDPDGGIVVSENYYFDSEIYSNKLYVFTDRPLYQPGDTVHVKVMGREFVNSQKSTVLANAPMQLSVFDAIGTRIVEQNLTLPSLADGASTSFIIPDEAAAGGYGLQIQYKKTLYSSAFRVARYVKPHFQIAVNFDKPAYKTGETIKGQVQLTYGNGEAVKNALVELEVRKQRLTIVEGEVEAKDRFPLQVVQTKLTSDGSGKADFEIPAASESSRFTVHVKVADQSSYRISATRDLLVQMVERPLALRSSTNFSQPKEKFKLSWSLDGAQKPQSWEAIRLQDQSRLQGDLDKGTAETSLAFDQAGSYSIHLLDAQGLILGSISHSVLGPELATVPGTISIIFDKDEYDVGSTARASITFSEPIRTALVTMELDQVERYTLIQKSQKWIGLTRVSDQQYLAEIPVEESYSPNITLSFAYVAKGQYVFENKGLKVRKPSVKIAITPDKTEYKPGERVNLDIQSTYQNQPVSTALTLAVVDEMIYGLQPEIAPHIMDFFFHPRRNQVRTASSLSFHSYDAAVSAIGIMPSSGSGGYSERSLKVRVRPRRDDKDTAAWAPDLRTDEQGKLRFSFTMPDSLTRWRVTARAMTAQGHVGQGTTSLLSKKDVYMKWTAVNQYREGDQSQVQLALFNMHEGKKDVVLDVKSAGGNLQKSVTLEPGPNYVEFPQTFKESTKLMLTVKRKDDVLDQLEVPVSVVPVGWSSTQNATLHSDFKMPASAQHIRLGTTGAGTEAFLAIADDLIDYPYGCVEQTSSRLISLALIQLNLKKWSLDSDMERQLHRRLNSERLQLIKMAGPEARFTWWGRSSQDSLVLTAYAYFADWWATRAMGTELPKKHWETLLDFYASRAEQATLDERILFVWMASEMNLPVKNLVGGLVEKAETTPQFTDESWQLIGGPESDHTLLILLDMMSRKQGVSLPEKLNARVLAAKEAAQQTMGLDRVAYLYANTSDANLAGALLNAINSSEWSTFKRTLSMVMLYKVMGGTLNQPSQATSPGDGWLRRASVTGRTFWSFDPKAGRPAWNALPQLPEGTAWRVSYDSFDEAKGTLPLKIERRLYRLVQKDKPLSYTMQLVEKPWVLDPRDLYLDELELKGGDKPLKFGLVTAGLPPGAAVEETSWGLTVTNAEGGTIELDSSGLQSGAGYYARAVEELSESKRIYQLVRFSQAGKFKVPQARFFKMYDPGQQAFEGGSSTASQTLEVR